jgi:hypothetical protein
LPRKDLCKENLKLKNSVGFTNTRGIFFLGLIGFHDGE